MIKHKHGNKDRILELLIATEKEYTVKELAKKLNVNKSTVEHHLKNLLKENQVKVKQEIRNYRNQAQYLTRVFWA